MNRDEMNKLIFCNRREYINYQIETEYKIAILINKIDQSLKNQNKENFLKYTEELNKTNKEMVFVKEYNDIYYKGIC